MSDYNIWDTRLIDLNNLDINECNVHKVYHLNPRYLCLNFNSEVEPKYFSALEFTVSNSVAKFCYDLTKLKYKFITDKPGMPDRTEYERMFDTFIGIVSECLTYIYLNSLGIENILYYDVERKSIIYNDEEEYDLKINDYNMSLKILPDYIYEKDGNDIYFPPLYIKKTSRSVDRYYTQFILPRNVLMSHDEIMRKFIDNMNNNEPLFLKFWMIGGVVENGEGGIFWEDFIKYLEEGEKNHTKKLKFEKKYDIDNYIPKLLLDIQSIKSQV